MITLSKYKELLGDEAQWLTDEEIEHIRDIQYRFAELAFEFWMSKKAKNLENN